MKQPQQQLCINHCSQARNNQPCATCLLSTAVSSREEDTAFEIAELHNKCRTTQVIVAVMWALGHSTPVKICGGV